MVSISDRATRLLFADTLLSPARPPDAWGAQTCTRSTRQLLMPFTFTPEIPPAFFFSAFTFTASTIPLLIPPDPTAPPAYSDPPPQFRGFGTQAFRKRWPPFHR